MINLKTIWKNKALIWEGFMNKIFKKDPIEVIYNKRKKICNGCPLIDAVGTSCMVPGTHPCCSACGCSLSMKLRSLDSECAHPDGPKWTTETI